MWNKGHFESQGSPLQVAGRRCHRGFTLIEVLISMTIFSVAILGLAIGASSVMRANQTSYFSTIGVSLAQDKLEELKANPATLAPCSTNCDSTVPTHNGVEFIRTWDVTDGSPVSGVSRVDVTVEWTDHMTHTVSISSLVLN